MKFLGNVIKRMSIPVYSQQNLFRRSFILVNLILSSYSQEYGLIKHLKDIKGYSGISTSWNIEKCGDTWSHLNGFLSSCLPKKADKANCTALSLSYNVNKVKELYVNIETETRICAKIKNGSICTGTFNTSVHYEMNKNIVKSFPLPDEIPKKNSSFAEAGKFYDTNDTVSFSVDKNFKSLKLGFQAPFYCGLIKSVSVFYYLCPAKTNALVDFLEVPAPSKMSSPYTSTGFCTKNAVKKYGSDHLSMKCYYNGTAEVSGHCECKAGYTKNKNICKG